MSMRMAPPGLTSNTHTGFVNPCGPHHCAMWLGSVHILKTISRGASNVRVITSFRSASFLALLFVFAVICFLQFFDVEFHHFEHRLHDALRFRGVLVAQQLAQNGGYDLPKESIFVFEPA